MWEKESYNYIVQITNVDLYVMVIIGVHSEYIFYSTPNIDFRFAIKSLKE